MSSSTASTIELPPRGLRLIYLPGRLIIHDITFSLRRFSASNRNALIDAANSVHLNHSSPQSQSSVPELLDFEGLPSPPPPSLSSSNSKQHRYLVLPYATESSPRNPPKPYEATSAIDAGLSSKATATSLHVDAAAAFIGLVPLHTTVFAIFASQVRHAANLPTGSVECVSKVALIPLTNSLPSKEDKDSCTAISKLLESGSFYYSVNVNLCTSFGNNSDHDVEHQFQWNHPLLSRLLPTELHHWSPNCLYGFVTYKRMLFSNLQNNGKSAEFYMALISRRSRRRAGTRFITRGVDNMGDVANFVETEQLIWCGDEKCGNGTGIKPGTKITSFIITRGSIPIFWRQNNGIARPAPELDSGLISSRKAFTLHFDNLNNCYGDVCAVSLVDKHGAEKVLADAYDKHFDLYKRYKHVINDMNSLPTLVAFDFHAYCAGKEYERGLSLLMNRLRKGVEICGFHVFQSNNGNGNNEYKKSKSQHGVLRVNCVDCLDRTNVVQTMIGREIMINQLEVVFSDLFDNKKRGMAQVIELFAESEDRFKHIWGDNADAISKQYSGTGALKTDFTRTGKRSTSGVIGDGVKSVMRMYYKNFVDEGRQEVIDIICGNAIIREQQLSFPNTITEQQISINKSKSKSVSSSTLWYSFEGMRINAGGDKQSVYIELYDKVMYVTTTEGICFEYPRSSLLSWSKREDYVSNQNINQRRTGSPCRLRLIYKSSYNTPATASPLDLQFKGGIATRENFLRALLSWSKPETVSLINSFHDIRIRILTLTRKQNDDKPSIDDWNLKEVEDNEICVLMIANGNNTALQALPIDVDKLKDVEVISAFSTRTNSEIGAPAIAVLASNRIAQTVMSVDEGVDDGLVGVSMDVCGTSICFVCCNVNDTSQLYDSLSNFKLGKHNQDITSQFDHFLLAGRLGSDVKWGSSRESRKWIQIEDGSFCYTNKSNISVMRNSIPSLRYDDLLPSSSTVLVDALIDGRKAPELPKRLCKCKVSISELRGEDIKIPRGVENGISGMNCCILLQTSLSTLDTVSSRVTIKPSIFPDWQHETLVLPMMPSDVEDVFNSVIYGQIIVPNVIGDVVIAGSFVFSLATIPRDGSRSGGLDVRCRIGGRATGRVVGTVLVDVIDDDGSGIVNELGMDNSDELGKGRSTASQVFGDYEVNERLEAARKKGAKQMKSVVNKLSSFMSSSSQSQSHNSTSHFPPYRAGTTTSSQSANSSAANHGSGHFPRVQTPSTTTATATTSSHNQNADALLMGLSTENSSSIGGPAAARHADTIPLYVANEQSDSLLSGLAAQKQSNNNEDDDGWGEFESVLTSTQQSQPNRR